MTIGELFKVFSKREDIREDTRPLTKTFKNRVLMRCRDLFGSSGFWEEIHSKLTYLHGRPQLTENTQNTIVDALEFLSQCDDKHFLDFIEYIFPTQAYFHAARGTDLVEDINEFLRQDSLPYALTDFVWTDSSDGLYQTRTLAAHPQVICKDSEVLHSSAIGPTLELLRGPEFSVVNEEFLKALEDYRKGDYGDCLTKCCSAFESALKVFCSRNNWPHKDTDTASVLLKTVISRSGLEGFFEQPLILLATMRNKLSTSHGGGTSRRTAARSRAEYAVSSTAAAIILLHSEC